MTDSCSNCSRAIQRKTEKNHLVLDGQLVCRQCILWGVHRRLRRLTDSLLPKTEITGRGGPNLHFVQHPANQLFNALSGQAVFLPLEAQLQYTQRIGELAPEPSEDHQSFIDEYKARARGLAQELTNGGTQ